MKKKIVVVLLALALIAATIVDSGHLKKKKYKDVESFSIIQVF